VRGTLGRGVVGLGLAGGALVADQALAQTEQLAAEPGDVLRQLEHGAILRHDMMLEMRDLFLQTLNFFFHES